MPYLVRSFPDAGRVQGTDVGTAVLARAANVVILRKRSRSLANDSRRRIYAFLRTSHGLWLRPGVKYPDRRAVSALPTAACEMLSGDSVVAYSRLARRCLPLLFVVLLFASPASAELSS